MSDTGPIPHEPTLTEWVVQHAGQLDVGHDRDLSFLLFLIYRYFYICTDEFRVELDVSRNDLLAGCLERLARPGLVAYRTLGGSFGAWFATPKGLELLEYIGLTSGEAQSYDVLREVREEVLAAAQTAGAALIADVLMDALSRTPPDRQRRLAAAVYAHSKSVEEVRNFFSPDDSKEIRRTTLLEVERMAQGLPQWSDQGAFAKRDARERRLDRHESERVETIRIRIRSFDHDILDQSARKIVDAAERTECVVSGPIPLPTRMERYTVLRSPHIDKKSREQFEIRTHKRLIDIASPNTRTIDALNNIIFPSGVDIRIDTIIKKKIVRIKPIRPHVQDVTPVDR